jgi:hypothetical protein
MNFYSHSTVEAANEEQMFAIGNGAAIASARHKNINHRDRVFDVLIFQKSF